MPLPLSRRVRNPGNSSRISRSPRGFSFKSSPSFSTVVSFTTIRGQGGCSSSSTRLARMPRAPSRSPLLSAFSAFFFASFASRQDSASSRAGSRQVNTFASPIRAESRRPTSGLMLHDSEARPTANRPVRHPSSSYTLHRTDLLCTPMRPYPVNSPYSLLEMQLLERPPSRFQKSSQDVVPGENVWKSEELARELRASLQLLRNKRPVLSSTFRQHEARRLSTIFTGANGRLFNQPRIQALRTMCPVLFLSDRPALSLEISPNGTAFDLGGGRFWVELSQQLSPKGR